MTLSLRRRRLGLLLAVLAASTLLSHDAVAQSPEPKPGKRTNIFGGGATRIGPSGATSTGGGLMTAFASGLIYSSINVTGFSQNGTTSISLDTQLGLLLVHQATPGKTSFGLAATGGIYRSVRPSGDAMLTVGGAAFLGLGNSPLAILFQGAAVIPPEGDTAPLFRVGAGFRF